MDGYREIVGLPSSRLSDSLPVRARIASLALAQERADVGESVAKCLLFAE